MTQKIEQDLEQLRATELIKDFHVSLGYGLAEFTIDVNPVKVPNIKAFALKLKDKYGATDFRKYGNGNDVSIKFVVRL